MDKPDSAAPLDPLRSVLLAGHGNFLLASAEALMRLGRDDLADPLRALSSALAGAAQAAAAPRDRPDAERVAMDALNEARARLGVDESSAAVRKAWAQARSAMRAAFADPASPLRGMESAAAPIGAPDARPDALRDLLQGVAPDDETCLLCGTRGVANCCPVVAAARAALAPEKQSPAAASLEVEALGLSGPDEMLKDLADCRYLKQCSRCPDRVLKMRAALARAILRGSGR